MILSEKTALFHLIFEARGPTFLYFLGPKSCWWRLVVLQNHQQMAAMHQKPLLGFSRLARQHKREAPLMMRSQAGLDRWHSLSSLWFYPSQHLLCLCFRPDGGSGTTDNRVRVRHPHLFSPHTNMRSAWPPPPSPLCIWFGAGQRQFAEAALDSAALLWRGSIKKNGYRTRRLVTLDCTQGT